MNATIADGLQDRVNEDAINVSEIIHNNNNTLIAATITVREHGNISHSPYVTVRQLGPIVDEHALFSAIGSTEPELLRTSETIDVDPLTDQIKHLKLWKFGYGNHASTDKPILDSVMLGFNSDRCRPIDISISQ